MRDLELPGYWWLPAYPDERVPGTLTYSRQAGAGLALIGALRDDRSGPSTSLPTHPVLHGESQGKFVTLLSCHTTRRAPHFGPAAISVSERLEPEVVLLGVLLDDRDEAVFDRLVFGLENLLPWSRRSGLEESMDMPGEGESGRVNGLARSFRPPEALQAALPGAVVRLVIDAAVRETHQRDSTAVAIEERARLVVEVERPEPVLDLLHRTGPFQDLLTLATGQRAGLTHLSLGVQKPEPATGTKSPEATPAPAEDEEALAERVHVDPRVSVEVFAQATFPADPDARALDYSPYHMLFTLDDVTFDEVVTRWHRLYERVAPACHLLFGLRYIETGYVASRLVTAVGAAETLHRRLYSDERPWSAEDFAALRAGALQGLDKRQAKWVNEKLFNELTLRERLLALIDRVGADVVAPFIPDREQWASAVKNARNDLTHQDPKREQRRPTTRALFALIETTAALLTLALLKELDVDRSLLNRVVTEHKHFRWVADLGPREAPAIFGAQKSAGSDASGT